MDPAAAAAAAADAAGKAAADAAAAAEAAAGPGGANGAASGRTTPGWNGLAGAGQTPEDMSRLARAALQTTPALFTATGGAGGAGPVPAIVPDVAAAAAAAAAAGLDPSQNPMSPEQLAGLLAATGYTLNSAALNATDPATLNMLLTSGLGFTLNTGGMQDLTSLALAGMTGGGDGDMDDGTGGAPGKGLATSTNKQLSSRYRGVCWNKKNKRWQAAINSSGKYLYLGSFTNEDDAARQFDRAAIKLRGKKAKLNFEYAEYVDEHGELLEDVQLPAGATAGRDEQGGRASGGGGRRGGKPSSLAGCDPNAGLDMAGLSAAFGFGGDLMNQATLAALMQGGAWPSAGRAGKTAAMVAPMGLDIEGLMVLLPKGASVEYTVQPSGSVGDAAGGNTLYGVVYKDEGGQFGAAVWSGYMLKTYGSYESEAAASQTARMAADMLVEDRDMRVTGGLASTVRGGAAGALGAMPGAGGAAGQVGNDALTLASLAAAGRGGAAGAGGALNVGLLGVGGGLMGANIGTIANLSLGQAQQLAQQAAAEQQAGLAAAMAYPPLSVALPVVSAGLQLGGGLGGAGGVAGLATSGGLPAGLAGTDVGGAAGGQLLAGMQGVTGEAEMQQLMQQLMQQQDAAQAGGLMKLANLDMAQLKQQLEQQQAVMQDGQQHQNQHQQDGGDDNAAAAAAAGGGLVGAKRGASDDGGDAKRARHGDDDGAAAAAAEAEAAAAAAAGGAAAKGELSQMALQDALKMLGSMQQQQGGGGGQDQPPPPAGGEAQ